MQDVDLAPLGGRDEVGVLERVVADEQAMHGREQHTPHVLVALVIPARLEAAAVLQAVEGSAEKTAVEGSSTISPEFTAAGKQ